MSSRRRSVAFVVTAVLVGVVVLGVVVVAVIGLPVVVAMGVALLALVAGVGSRIMGGPRRRGRPRSFAGHSGAQVRSAGLQWTTRWESRPAVDAVPFARGRLSTAIDDWGVAGETRDDVLLVVTELLSNAVEHADGPVRLVAALRDGSVRVEVHDAVAAPPRPGPSEPLGVSGRGLQVVEALTSNWGWTHEADGKVVWAEVPDGRSSRAGADHPDDR